MCFSQIFILFILLLKYLPENKLQKKNQSTNHTIRYYLVYNIIEAITVNNPIISRPHYSCWCFVHYILYTSALDNITVVVVWSTDKIWTIPSVVMSRSCIICSSRQHRHEGALHVIDFFYSLHFCWLTTANTPTVCLLLPPPTIIIIYTTWEKMEVKL